MCNRTPWRWALVLLAAWALACGSRTQKAPAPLPESTELPPPAPPAAEPPGASAEELETVPAPPPVAPEAEGWADASPPPPELPPRTTFGYRVQIFASATRPGADRVAAEAQGRFPESVAIEYEAPFYKVRVGNCVTRHEAERLRQRADELGYEGAFITETMVEVR